MTIPLFKPTIRRKEMDNVLSCMVSDFIGPGKTGYELAASLAYYLQAAGGVALSSYYSALLLSLDLLNLKPEDKVIISPLSPAVYLDVLAAKGLKPLFAGVDADSACLAAGELAADEFKEAKALLLHYTLGFVPDVPLLKQYGIPIIEDVSEALGAKWGDELCGSFGDITVLSLDQKNIITTGGGGLVLVKKKQDQNALKRILELTPAYSPLADLNAAVGLSQFKQLPLFLETRSEIADLYAKALLRSKHGTLVQKGDGKNVYFSFPVLVSQGIAELRKFVKKQQIETHAAFNETVITRHDEIYNTFPAAKNLLLRCVLFPLYPALGKKNVEEIAKVLAVLP